MKILFEISIVISEWLILPGKYWNTLAPLITWQWMNISTHFCHWIWHLNWEIIINGFLKDVRPSPSWLVGVQWVYGKWLPFLPVMELLLKSLAKPTRVSCSGLTYYWLSPFLFSPHSWPLQTVSDWCVSPSPSKNGREVKTEWICFRCDVLASST